MSDFYTVLHHILGQALAAARYELENNPMQQARGLYRYGKKRNDHEYVFIEFQTLYHSQSELSRFRITLLKNSQPAARAATPQAVEKSLSEVIWQDFGARVLPDADYWWLYKHPRDLAPEMYEAGKLLFAYGVPWLEGTIEG